MIEVSASKSLEFIHSFADGNGRIGRLWQSLVLSHWNPLFAYLPVETVVRDRQAGYYPGPRRLRQRRRLHSLHRIPALDPFAAFREAGNLCSGEQLSEQVARFLRAYSQGPRSKARILESAGFANAYLNYKRRFLPLLQSGLLERTIPEKLNSRLQKYRITVKGRAVVL